MSCLWEIYDRLIAPIPGQETLAAFHAGRHWTWVESSEGGVGLAATAALTTVPPLRGAGGLAGMSLREAAELVKSWNLLEASIGLAAINSWYNHPRRAEANVGLVPGKD